MSLAEQGHRADVAHSGEEALNLLGSAEPDVVFLDVVMPGMNGLDVLAEVKRRRPSLPVLIITGNATSEEVDKVKRLGAVDVSEKPAPLMRYQTALRRLGATS
jgi:DNA-binding NtrC family response regulator